ncbi:MAG: TIGR02301 family protein, partial [Pseudomonadota bacterium]
MITPEQHLTSQRLRQRYCVKRSEQCISVACVALASVIIAAMMTMGPTRAAAQAQSDRRPYDTELLRLSEILGGIHYLRELCGGKDGQTWRLHMQALIDAEGTTALRRATLARRFNQGYRNYSRTYKSCSVTAKAALDRFVRDGKTAADE